MNIVTNLFTGKDNKTHDLGRWSWALSFVLVAALALWHEYKGIAVDLTTLAQAICLVVGAHGAALWAKSSTEPDSPKD